MFLSSGLIKFLAREEDTVPCTREYIPVQVSHQRATAISLVIVTEQPRLGTVQKKIKSESTN